MMSYPLNSILHTTAFGKYDVGPSTVAWVDRVRARPAYKRAMERLAKEDAAAAEQAKAAKDAKAKM